MDYILLSAYSAWLEPADRRGSRSSICHAISYSHIPPMKVGHLVSVAPSRVCFFVTKLKPILFSGTHKGMSPPKCL
ncbi:hypothetical protein L484_012999 [Morus notabilis]|uniref:Uncharacterized protein n=1 Tax=Morus notabilis TaxID=981085 RepID=W9S3F1_9ROSA|nr:hypothetical protein L484_012999 [Morus notabilis]